MSRIAFVWDNFGPMHVERCEAVAAALPEGWTVIGLEEYAASDTYDWHPEASSRFEKRTIFADPKARPGVLRRIVRMVRAARACQAKHVFWCNYERPEVLISALVLRLTGRRCYVMGCSKFDDYPRSLWREGLKSLFFLPYRGGLSSGVRGRDYMRFRGLPAARVVGEYNTLSIDRVRSDAGVPPAPGGVAFADRPFLIVARFVAKKNLEMALAAYALYAAQSATPRALVLCGSGPLEAELRAQVAALGLGGQVRFEGFVQRHGIARWMGRSLCLLLPSLEEQFGNVVIEAQAMGMPVILSDSCGARDKLVRSGQNGFVVEPDNPEGMAFFMGLIAGDEALWRRLAQAALASAPQGDTARFAEGVLALVAPQPDPVTARKGSHD